MTAAAKKDTAGAEPAAWENPLIPNKKLRALYVAMVELRLLQEHVSKLPRGTKKGGAAQPDGEEGCRVSTTFDLKLGDLTSDVADGLSTSFLRGEKLAEVVHRAHTAGSLKAATGSAARDQLPAMKGTNNRLHLAMGAALALKSMKKGALVIAYVHGNEATPADWKPMLRFAADLVLPIIFVVLPPARATSNTMKAGQFSLASSRCGVPGIPVDVADPVALYRVAQESMLRSRAGGGPVLMECIAFQLAGKKAAPADPIVTMQEFLLKRRIVDGAWLQSVESRFRERLETVEG